MKVLFAAAEVAPFSKVGGLADVVGSLPKELGKHAEIAIFTPLHGCIDREKFGIKEYPNSEMWITFGNQGHKFKLHTCKLPDTKINVFFIENDWYFGCFKEVYPKYLDTRYEHERYVAFSLAVLEYAKALNFKADVVHTHDWHTAMIPMFIKANYKYDEFWNQAKNVFQIHNLAYQGTWHDDILDFANMRKDIVFNEWGLEHYGMVNWVKGAINYSDAILVVSPKYAQEILTPEFGEGMDYTLRMNQHKIHGILNGIDYSAFDPKKDKALVKNYDARSIKKKQENKKAVCEHFGLKYNPNRPLVAMISRLVDQKGIDLIRAEEGELMNMPADFVFLGSGATEYENLLIWLSNNSANIRAEIGYNAKLANLIYAGSDLFLMPSRFEPCGLSQLISMHYGSLPVVRATGGLDDTVKGEPIEEANGFKFWRYNGWDMKEALYYAINIFNNNKKAFEKMQKNAMTTDFSWKISAQKYMDLYKNLLK